MSQTHKPAPGNQQNNAQTAYQEKQPPNELSDANQEEELNLPQETEEAQEQETGGLPDTKQQQ